MSIVKTHRGGGWGDMCKMTNAKDQRSGGGSDGSGGGGGGRTTRWKEEIFWVPPRRVAVCAEE